jgi:FkbM family methyltransferase
MSQLRSDLIYDVGLFDGEDTASYLFHGYNVVAIDANPVMIEMARLRFAREIQDKRLTLLNVGISNTPGTETFWVSDKPDWSSFDRTIASRNGTGHRSIHVPVVRFAQLVAEYGVPHYLKIDIEGNDRLCVEALKGRTLPKYISAESECVGDSTLLSDDEATAMLESLRDVGYRRFKLVDQSRPRDSEGANAAARFGKRLVTRTAHSLIQLAGISAIARRFVHSARVANLGLENSRGSSRRWGEDAPGVWMSFERARSVYLQERHAFFAQDRPLYSFWCDWHATK